MRKEVNAIEFHDVAAALDSAYRGIGSPDRRLCFHIGCLSRREAQRNRVIGDECELRSAKSPQPGCCDCWFGIGSVSGNRETQAMKLTRKTRLFCDADPVRREERITLIIASTSGPCSCWIGHVVFSGLPQERFFDRALFVTYIPLAACSEHRLHGHGSNASSQRL